MMKKRSALSTYVHNNRIYVWAFAIPAAVMLVIFMMAKVYPFGDRSFLHIDMYHQYFPFLTDLYHAVRGGGAGTDGSGLLYSFNSGLGNNFYALWAYYLSSPLNIFAFIVPEKYLMEFFSYLSIVKIGLCGSAFAYYLIGRFHKDKSDDVSILFFSTFYALSGFIAAYNWDLMWLDVVALAPIVILGLERLVASHGKDLRLYTISLAVALFCNYYLCIMLCIYMVLYYLLVLLPGVIASADAGKAKAAFRTSAGFAAGSIFAACLSGIILIPSYMAVRMTRFHASSFPSSYKAYFDVFTMSARHLMDVAVETGLNHWPNIYASVAVLFLLPLYLICKKIPLREKIGRFILLAFIFYSFSVNVLSYLWHGLNYPDSLPARQSYLYVFLLLSMCYEAFIHIKEQSKVTIGITAIIVMGYLVCVQRWASDDAITERTIGLSSLAVVIYIALIYTYWCMQRAAEAEDKEGKSDTPHADMKKHAAKIRRLGYAALAVVILESGINMKLTSVPTVSRTTYLENFSDYEKLYEENNELDDGLLYRFERVDRLTNNDAMLKAYPSLSLFSSISNGLVNDFYSDYGMRTSKVFYCEDGMTLFIRALLSDKYIFIEEGDEHRWEGLPVHKVSQSGTVSLYATDDTLPVGYMLYPEGRDMDRLIADPDAPDDKEDTEDKKTNPVIRQNELAAALGAKTPLYNELVTIEQTDSSDFVAHDSGIHIAYCNTKKIDTLYADLPGGSEKYRKLKNPYIIDLGHLNAGDIVHIENKDEADLHMKVYLMDEDVYKEVIESLKKDTYKIYEGGYGSNELTGSIDVTSDGYMILSIPYDKGWHIYVDGKRTEGKIAYGMMTAVALNTGKHIVTLKYVPAGLIPGTVLTLVSVALLCVLIKRRSI